MALFAEMRRRNVIKVALLYAVLSWLVVWFVGVVQSEVSVPAWTEKFMYFVLVVGLPVALWFAWTYEITVPGEDVTGGTPDTPEVLDTGTISFGAAPICLSIR